MTVQTFSYIMTADNFNELTKDVHIARFQELPIMCTQTALKNIVGTVYFMQQFSERRIWIETDNKGRNNDQTFFTIRREDNIYPAGRVIASGYTADILHDIVVMRETLNTIFIG